MSRNRDLDIHPATLLGLPQEQAMDDCRWHVVYTRARREKVLAHCLYGMRIPFYCPLIAHRTRAPSGRIRRYSIPLFSSYLFMFGTSAMRESALQTNHISHILTVPDEAELCNDLRRIRHLIESGVPISLEQRMPAGACVRVRRGPLKGLEGMVLQRRTETRLIVLVNFLQQGASVLVDMCDVERIE